MTYNPDLPEDENNISPERIAKHYSAAQDSINLINDILANPEKYADDPTALDRNLAHLEGIRNAPFWTTEEFTGWDNAVANGRAAMPDLPGQAYRNPNN